MITTELGWTTEEPGLNFTDNPVNLLTVKWKLIEKIY